QPIRFQGQHFDEETGLSYNRFRYYDPDMGMFTTRDPIQLQGGLNVFQYAPNPTGWVDPLGLLTLQNARTSLVKRRVSREGFGGLAHSDEQVFREWHRLEMLELARPRNWTTALPRCPAKLRNCTGSNWEEPGAANSEHPGGVTEVRSISINGSSNQCVYDGDGNIMTTIPAAGTADRESCSVVGLCGLHGLHDLRPWQFAKRLDNQIFEDTGQRTSEFRQMYYEARPILVEGMNGSGGSW
ncbi:RHS repeat-associated core domain-containing protein, partial [Psychrobacter sp. HII-4]|uniref:RHS repeat-associated core domain-containing protein n=1 Tax=Psychrobacter sp. HII-4 TaxID=1569264 RepID=UPI001D12C7E5